MIVSLVDGGRLLGRKDVKESSWVRLDTDITTSRKYYFLNAAEFKALIHMFCLVGQERQEEIEIDFDYAERVAGIPAEDFKAAISKLSAKGLLNVHVTRTLRARNVDVALYPNERTNERSAYDFESLYSKYPRKVGKTQGLKRCKAEIKTDSDFEALSKAIDAYKAYIRKQSVEPKYIKHFSTFMASWRDWLDPESGSTGNNGAPNPLVAELVEQLGAAK